VEQCTIYTGSSIVTFDGNTVTGLGGAITSLFASSVVFNRYSLATFKICVGGAVYSNENSTAHFSGITTVMFDHNTALYGGGAITCTTNCGITIEGIAKLTFNNNFANFTGRALLCFSNHYIIFSGKCDVSINSNATSNGGGIYGGICAIVIFARLSVLKFNNNAAYATGGAFLAEINSAILFHGNILVKFSKK